MNSHAGRSSESAPSRDSIIAERRRQLCQWAYFRRLLCFVFVFPFAIAATNPQFGMGGPDFLWATLITLAFVAINGVILAVRIRWELLRIDAELVDSTRPYLLGHRFRQILRMAVR